MKKYKLYAVVALLAVPSIMISTPGNSTSSLPDIDGTAKSFQQQSCPVGGGFGCFDGSRPSPFSFCRQFMQMFARPRAG